MKVFYPEKSNFQLRDIFNIFTVKKFENKYLLSVGKHSLNWYISLENMYIST